MALELARQYRDRGFEIAYVTMQYDGLLEREALERGVDVFRIRSGRRHQDSSYLVENLRFLLAALKPLRRICEERSIRFVHAHSILPEGLLALAAKRWIGPHVPTVVTSHGSDVPGYNLDRFRFAHRVMSPVWHYAVKRFDVLTAPGRQQADLIKANRPGQHVRVIPNGIHANAFADVPADRDGSFLIVSRLVDRKNYHSFLEALAEIRMPQRVHIVGEGPARPELEELASRIGQHDVIFHGWIPHGSLQWKELYRTASYFVFPSLAENFPMSLLEAQLAGLLVLATPIAAHREVLGDHAVFFDGTRADDMVGVLSEITASGPADYGERRAAGRKRVIDKFSWDTIAERYLAVAGIVVDDHGPTHGDPTHGRM